MATSNPEVTLALTEAKSTIDTMTASLKDANTKLSDATTKLTAAEGQVADLSLSLKDEKAKREAAETELKTLRDAQAKREEKDLTDRVQLAYETYKDAHKLTDEDKETMLIVLKAKPESFEKKYPKVPPAQQHMLRNLTDHRPSGAPVLMGDDDGGTRTIDARQLAKTIAAQKGIPLDQAQRLVAMKLGSAHR